jgi:hypothetical protein
MNKCKSFALTQFTWLKKWIYLVLQLYIQSWAITRNVNKFQIFIYVEGMSKMIYMLNNNRLELALKGRVVTWWPKVLLWTMS